MRHARVRPNEARCTCLYTYARACTHARALARARRRTRPSESSSSADLCADGAVSFSCAVRCACLPAKSAWHGMPTAKHRTGPRMTPCTAWGWHWHRHDLGTAQRSAAQCSICAHSLASLQALQSCADGAVAPAPPYARPRLHSHTHTRQNPDPRFRFRRRAREQEFVKKVEKNASSPAVGRALAALFVIHPNEHYHKLFRAVCSSLSSSLSSHRHAAIVVAAMVVGSVVIGQSSMIYGQALCEFGVGPTLRPLLYMTPLIYMPQLCRSLLYRPYLPRP